MRDKLIEKASDVDELQYRIHCATELVRMVHASLTQDVNEPGENDFDGLFGAYWLLSTLEKEMHQVSEELCSAIHKNLKHNAVEEVAK